MEPNAGSLIAEVERRLRAAFAPERLALRDDTWLHLHHPARGAGLHLHLEIVSALFQGQSLLERHRAVHKVLSDLLPGAIHALSLVARAPDEVAGSARRSG